MILLFPHIQSKHLKHVRRKQMNINEGAKHAQSYEKDPVGYEEKLRSFLAHLNNIRKNDIV